MKSIAAVVLFLPCLVASAAAFRPAEVNRKAPPPTRHTNDDDSRRAFLTAAASALTLITYPTVSNAAYGEDAKIMIPDVVQSMSDRTNKQCLVESLGNRDCLVYLDPENQVRQTMLHLDLLVSSLDNLTLSKFIFSVVSRD
jgi:hypothetical protein